MNAVREISQRLSLRPPLEESLRLLAGLIEDGLLPLDRSADVATILESVRTRLPSVTSFERAFPSLCFALATGVGKTRLMAAMMTWLYRTGRSRDFVVLAPNLTIYEKLKHDFDPASDKYLFRGLSDFAVQPPLLIHGENWSTGTDVRLDDAAPMTVPGQLLPQSSPVIRIFNIAKFLSRGRGVESKEVSKTRKLSEYLGTSYFDYLASRPNLVLFMDEAHRYRADAGAKSIDELKPVLGIELTATAKATGAATQEFKNIAFRFPLARALEAGYVKAPTVATRKDFDARAYKDDGEELERIKLEDGVHVHEAVKLALVNYAQTTGAPLVHPFMLVVARDIEHAKRVRSLIEGDKFFDGRYAGRVIEIHSKTSATESDENTAKLLRIEHDAAVDIVVHVNKLQEGWDVTNLFTIVPLRASAAEILTEQTIGRGLRLPFSQRTGDPTLDRLTIIAHDKFKEIIDKANEPDSLIRDKIEIGPGADVEPTLPKQVTSIPTYQYRLLQPVPGQVQDAAAPQLPPLSLQMLETVREAMDQEGMRTPAMSALRDDRRIDTMAARITARLDLPAANAAAPPADIVRAQVKQVVEAMIDRSIDVPTITLLPSSGRHFRYEPFQLQHLDQINFQPATADILLHDLHKHDQALLVTGGTVHRESDPANYLVALLMAREQIDYDSHAEILHDLANQVVTRLRSYLPDEDAVHRVLQHQRRALDEKIWKQLEKHRVEAPVTYKVQITRGFTVLRPRPLNCVDGLVHPFTEPVPAGAHIRQLVFGGFSKCCFDTQKFDSKVGEYELVRVLERDDAVQKWIKPGRNQFVIEYNHGKRYEPDFVVETAAERLIIELKSEGWTGDAEVEAKAAAAAEWCKHATTVCVEHGGKPWTYLLIPHNAFGPQSTFGALQAAYMRR